MVAVAVAPGPVFLLFSGRQPAKITLGIAVIVAGPLVIEDDFVIIPDVVVAVVGVVDPVVMMFASRTQYGKRQSSSQETGTEKARLSIHLRMILL
jgi:hypothetical protein